MLDAIMFCYKKTKYSPHRPHYICVSHFHCEIIAITVFHHRIKKTSLRNMGNFRNMVFK